MSKGTTASGRPSQNIFCQGHSKGPELGHSLFVGGVPHQEEAGPEKLGWPYVPVHPAFFCGGAFESVWEAGVWDMKAKEGSPKEPSGTLGSFLI